MQIFLFFWVCEQFVSNLQYSLVASCPNRDEDMQSMASLMSMNTPNDIAPLEDFDDDDDNEGGWSQSSCACLCWRDGMIFIYGYLYVEGGVQYQFEKVLAYVRLW